MTRPPLQADQQAAPQSAWQLIRTTVLINVLNPKLTIFFFAFLPQFGHPSEQAATRHLAGLSLVCMVVTFLVFAARPTSPPTCGALCSGNRCTAGP